jgi:hypothetical protein
MIDSEKPADANLFRPFEGLWITTKSPGDLACAKTADGKLLIPYSRDGSVKPIGHYYDCKIIGTTLYGRFEHFDSALAGIIFLKIGPNETLIGGRWANNQIPEAVRQDISKCSESLPGMRPVVWVRILNKEIPDWAEKYFREEWPNKS